MRSIRDISVLRDIPVLVRAALNVPIENGQVASDYRIKKALLTIRFLTERGAKVILISHIGEAGTETLEPVARALGTFLPHVSFCPDTVGETARAAIRALTPGEVLVLENLRRNKGETANDPEFAHELATLADVFVEDSFDTCHRMHASIVSVPRLLPAYAGLLLEEEVAALGSALTPPHPALAIIGGAKFSTKEPVLGTLLASYDHVFVGGALANDFFAGQNHSIGKSLVSGADPEKIQALLANKKLILPIDVRVVPSEASEQVESLVPARTARIEDVQSNEVIVDVGPATTALVADLAKQASAVLWNGPLGKYEDGFVEATDDMARTIASTNTHSVIGGGDTIASITSLGLLPRFSFISTGGGAMLDFLAHGTLPGIQALDAHVVRASGF